MSWTLLPFASILNVPLPCVLLPSGGQKLKLTTSHLSIRVLPQVSVQHSITDLVTYLIWKKQNKEKSKRHKYLHVCWFGLSCDRFTAHARFLIWAEPENITPFPLAVTGLWIALIWWIHASVTQYTLTPSSKHSQTVSALRHWSFCNFNLLSCFMMDIFYITLKNVEILYYRLIVGETFMFVCFFKLQTWIFPICKVWFAAVLTTHLHLKHMFMCNFKWIIFADTFTAHVFKTHLI